MQCTVLVLCTVNSDLTMKHIYSVAPCWIPPSYLLVYKKHYFCLLEAKPSMWSYQYFIDK